MIKSHVPYKSFYRLTEAFRHISTNDTREVLDEQVVEFQFLGVEREELGFLVWQAENNKICFPEEARPRVEVDLIFKKLVLTTDLAGNIKRVLNKPDIAKAWGLLRNNAKYQAPASEPLTSRFDWVFSQPNGLEQFLASTKYTLLLSGFGSDTPEDTYFPGEQQIDYFLDEHLLPLSTNNCFSSPDDQLHAHQLFVVGMLNADKFDQKSFAKWLKRKVDIYDLKVVLTADFEQKQLFDHYQKIRQAEQFLAVEVPGCFNQTRARTLQVLE